MPSEDQQFLRQLPTQQRSIDTVDLILKVAAALLGEVGIERLSTNLICSRAGLTPPALYRYFPNKYAVLMELAKRLMERQNQAFLGWLQTAPAIFPVTAPEAAIQSLQQMQGAVNAATREFPAAVWIMRALRAVPLLQPLRLDAHNNAAALSFSLVRPHYPNATDAELRLATRLSTEMFYCATELVFDDPEIDDQRVNQEVAEMVVRYFDKFNLRSDLPI